MEDGEIRILLIEDNSGDALLFTEMLSEFGGRYGVTRADRLSRALELMERISFDLVVMDLNLPDGRGIESLEMVRGRLQLPVIVLTGVFDEKMAAAAGAEGAEAFLVKGDLDAGKMDTVIQQCLAKGRSS